MPLLFSFAYEPRRLSLSIAVSLAEQTGRAGLSDSL